MSAEAYHPTPEELNVKNQEYLNALARAVPRYIKVHPDYSDLELTKEDAIDLALGYPNNIDSILGH